MLARGAVVVSILLVFAEGYAAVRDDRVYASSGNEETKTSATSDHGGDMSVAVDEGGRLHLPDQKTNVDGVEEDTHDLAASAYVEDYADAEDAEEASGAEEAEDSEEAEGALAILGYEHLEGLIDELKIQRSECKLWQGRVKSLPAQPTVNPECEEKKRQLAEAEENTKTEVPFPLSVPNRNGGSSRDLSRAGRSKDLTKATKGVQNRRDQGFGENSAGMSGDLQKYAKYQKSLKNKKRLQPEVQACKEEEDKLTSWKREKAIQTKVASEVAACTQKKTEVEPKVAKECVEVLTALAEAEENTKTEVPFPSSVPNRNGGSSRDLSRAGRSKDLTKATKGVQNRRDQGFGENSAGMSGDLQKYAKYQKSKKLKVELASPAKACSELATASIDDPLLSPDTDRNLCGKLDSMPIPRGSLRDFGSSSANMSPELKKYQQNVQSKKAFCH